LLDTRDIILDLIEETERSGIPGIAPRNDGKSEARGRHLSAALGTMFRWLATKRRIAVNPFVGMDRPPPSNKRKRLLNFRIDMNDADEVRWFWKGCEEVGGPFGAIARLLLLTACHHGGGSLQGRCQNPFVARADRQSVCTH
jgi:hypothetical protein